MIHRKEIDGLRALAVSAVLLHHFFPAFFPNGYLGVDVFFVISGFVITGSLWNRERTNLRQFLLEFYVRRIKRLVPALAAC
ncbi:MAG: acyltransferase, partial [Pseudomonadota bacterium]